MARCSVGVLALQGDFTRHRAPLDRLGASVSFVRSAADLDRVDALVIPGGESTSMLTLLDEPFFDDLRRFVRERPVLGTCAGAILLARTVIDRPQRSLKALDVAIRRNAYGRQRQSSVRQGLLGEAPMEMVFIRAPRIEQVGPLVEILGRQGPDPVLVRQGQVIAATFHPELGDDLRVYSLFLAGIGQPARLSAEGER